MFDSVVLRNSEEEGNISIGAIAESILFYQNTRVVMGSGTLVSLAKTGNLGELIKLIREGRLHATHCEETLGTASNKFGASVAYDFGAMTAVGFGESRGKNRAERVEIHLRSNGIKPGDAKKLARDFVDIVPVKNLSSDDLVKGGIPHAARKELQDVRSLTELLRVGLDAAVGGEISFEDLEVDVVQTKLGNFVYTNVNFELINKHRAAMNPQNAPISLPQVLNLIQESRADMHFAAFYGGDFVTTSESSSMVKWRHEYIFDRLNINTKERKQFSQIVLAGFPGVKDVLNSGERNFSDFLKLMDKSDRFKKWLAKVNPDQNLVTQYIAEIKTDTWAEKTPTKILRYFFSLGAGAVDPTGGIISGAADSFLADKFLKGWRPNHFVDDRLKPFLHQ